MSAPLILRRAPISRPLLADDSEVSVRPKEEIDGASADEFESSPRAVAFTGGDVELVAESRDEVAAVRVLVEVEHGAVVVELRCHAPESTDARRAAA